MRCIQIENCYFKL